MSVKKLAPNLSLHISKVPLHQTVDLAHTLYTYSVSNKEVSDVHLTLDFSELSSNIEIETYPDLVVTAVIPPMSSQVVCIIRAYDTEWSTQCAVTVRKVSPSREVQAAYID